MMLKVGRHYVRYFNKTYRRSGALWEGRFTSCVLDVDDDLLTCQTYIESNPVRASIRQSANKGLALGNGRFGDQIASLTGRGGPGRGNAGPGAQLTGMGLPA